MHAVDTYITLAKVVGAQVPQDRPTDGVDQTDFLLGKSDKSSRQGFPVLVAERRSGHEDRGRVRAKPEEVSADRTRHARPILPVNTRALFPVTGKLNQEVAFTITDLNYTQFLSPNLALFFGKLDTLDADPNEFASGRGTSQFMNANFIFNPTLALRLPYSTLGAGVIWMPIPPGPRGGIIVSSATGIIGR